MISTMQTRPHMKALRFMADLTMTQAAHVVSQHRTTVWHWIKAGILPARQHGRRGDWQISVDELRKFAEKYNYKFNEELARQLALDGQ